MAHFYIVGTILFTVYGQLILKWRILKYGKMPTLFWEKLVFLSKLIIFDPFILSGYLSAFIASFFWMAAMTKFELSHAYPIIVGGLALLTSLLAILFLKEPVTVYKIIGILLIIAGVYLISRTA